MMHNKTKKLLSITLVAPLFMGTIAMPAANADENQIGAADTKSIVPSVNPGATLRSQGNFEDNVSLALTKADGTPVGVAALSHNGMARVSFDGLGETKEPLKIKVVTKGAKLDSAQCILKEVSETKSKDDKVVKDVDEDSTTQVSQSEEQMLSVNENKDNFDWISATVDERYEEVLKRYEENLANLKKEKANKEVISDAEFAIAFLKDNKEDSMRLLTNKQLIKSLQENGIISLSNEQELGQFADIVNSSPQIRNLLKNNEVLQQVVYFLTDGLRKIPLVGEFLHGGLKQLVNFVSSNDWIVGMIADGINTLNLPVRVDANDIRAGVGIVKDFLDISDNQGGGDNNNSGDNSNDDQNQGDNNDSGDNNDDNQGDGGNDGDNDKPEVTNPPTTSGDDNGGDVVVTNTNTQVVEKTETTTKPVDDDTNNSAEETEVVKISGEDVKVEFTEKNVPVPVSNNEATINVSKNDEIDCMLTIVKEESDSKDDKNSDDSKSEDGDKKSEDDKLKEYLEKIKAESEATKKELENIQKSTNNNSPVVAARVTAGGGGKIGPKVDTGGSVEKASLWSKIKEFLIP